jgi:hypothetical protein
LVLKRLHVSRHYGFDKLVKLVGFEVHEVVNPTGFDEVTRSRSGIVQGNLFVWLLVDHIVIHATH